MFLSVYSCICMCVDICVCMCVMCVFDSFWVRGVGGGEGGEGNEDRGGAEPCPIICL